MVDYTRDRGYTRARRMGRDEEEARKDLRELTEDEDCDFGDLLAAAINAASPEQQTEVADALRKMSEDSRGPRSWARDRLEMRRLGRDMRSRDRRLGRDLSVENLTEPGRSGSIEEFGTPGERRTEEAEDRRRRLAGDRMALDSRNPRGSFRAFYPQASRIERA